MEQSRSESPREKELAGVLATDVTVRVGEEDYTLTQLRMADFADAEEYVRNKRLDGFLEQTRNVRGVNLPDAVRAGAIGQIMNKPVPLEEVLDSVSGQLYLVFLSLRRNHSGLNFEVLKRDMDPLTIRTLGEIVFQITGLTALQDEEDPDPLHPRVSTFIIEKPTPNGPGEKSSAE